MDKLLINWWRISSINSMVARDWITTKQSWASRPHWPHSIVPVRFPTTTATAAATTATATATATTTTTTTTTATTTTTPPPRPPPPSAAATKTPPGANIPRWFSLTVYLITGNRMKWDYKIYTCSWIISPVTLPFLIPFNGKIFHLAAGHTNLQPYGEAESRSP